MPKLIICAGRSRSGSTLLYNLIRITIEEVLGDNNVYSTVYRNYDKNNNRPCHVVKTHGHSNYLFNNAAYIFSCERDLGEQKGSIRRFRKVAKNQNISDKDLEKFIKYDLNRYNKWKSHKNFVKTFKFNDLVNNKKLVISEIVDLLKLDVLCGLDTIIKKLNQLKLPKSGYDKKTGLTFGHFTSDIYRGCGND